MSDARTTPPSFEEMVGLIEKNFKDVLRYSTGPTPERIEKAWERYKVLNHLCQDADKPPAVKGAGWVYTAKSLPKDGTIVLCEYKSGDLSHMEYLEGNRNWWLRNVHRWLDESGESPTAAGQVPEQPEWIKWLTTDGPQVPDLSNATEDEKSELVNTLFRSHILLFMKLFYALGLKTHMECSAVNEGTNDLFRLRFELMQNGDGSLPAAGDGKEDDRTVFVPCDEHDPEVAGGYQSLDGQGMCYVKEVRISDIKGGLI